MDDANLSRRSLLQAIAATLATAAAPFGWAEIAEAAHDADVAAQGGGSPTLSLFTAAEAADMEAVASQIIPTDDSPGARVARTRVPGARDLARRSRPGARPRY